MTEQLRERLSSALVDLAKDASRYRVRLSEKGFRAFEPWTSLVLSFCDGREISEHEAFLQGVAEEGIASSGRSLHSGNGKGYKSPLLEMLRTKRDKQNGVAINELRILGRPIWQRELSPCERKRIEFSLREPDKYRELEEKRYREESAAKATEILIHCTRIGSEFAFDGPARVRFVRLICADALDDYGFALLESVSTEQSPIFGWRLHPEWEVRWAVLNPSLAFAAPGAGNLQFIVYLCSPESSVEPQASLNNHEFFWLRYDMLIPGFRSIYSAFSNLDELELVIRAHAALFGLARDDIGAAIMTAVHTST